MICAIDCDLRRVHCIDEHGVVLAKAAPSAEALLDRLAAYTPILFEVAGAKDYTDDKGTAYHKRRWTIFNIATASRLDTLLPGRILVAPSSIWTQGYSREQRHRLAGATASTKDLRECQSMIRAYQRRPDAWVLLSVFLNGL